MSSAPKRLTAFASMPCWPILNRMALTLMLFFLLGPLPAFAADLYFSKSTPHYAQELEFYYAKPRPEMLPAMLKSFGRSGLLENAEKRLFIAAFLAALIQSDSLDIYAIAKDIQQRDVAYTVATALHLANLDADISSILYPADQSLLPQISRLPSPLASWNPSWEKAALDLHWAAFMATGSNFWLDRIINCAIGYAHGSVGSANAAASLYEYAPRHAAIIHRLETFVPNLKESEQQVLNTILRHAYSAPK